MAAKVDVSNPDDQAALMFLEKTHCDLDVGYSGNWVDPSGDIVYVFGGEAVNKEATYHNGLWAINFATKEVNLIKPASMTPSARAEINPLVLPNNDDVLVAVGGYGESRPVASSQYFTTGLLYRMSTQQFTILVFPVKTAKPVANVSLVAWQNSATGCPHIFLFGGYRSRPGFAIADVLPTVRELTIVDPPEPIDGLWEIATRFPQHLVALPSKNQPSASPLPASCSAPDTENSDLPCPTTAVGTEDGSALGGEYWPYCDPSEATRMDPEDADLIPRRAEKNIMLFASGNSALHSFGLMRDDTSAITLKHHLFLPPSEFKPRPDASHIEGGVLNRDQKIKDPKSGVPLRPRIQQWGRALLDEGMSFIDRHNTASMLYEAGQGPNMRPEWRWEGMEQAAHSTTLTGKPHPNNFGASC